MQPGLRLPPRIRVAAALRLDGGFRLRSNRTQRARPACVRWFVCVGTKTGDSRRRRARDVREWRISSRPHGGLLLGAAAVALQILAGRVQYVIYTVLIAGAYALLLVLRPVYGREREAAWQRGAVRGSMEFTWCSMRRY